MFNTTTAIWNTNTGTLWGYHAICIIGYNNTTGMFKVQNQWGIAGGDQGFFYIPYTFVQSGNILEAYILYATNPLIPMDINGSTNVCTTAQYNVTNLPTGSNVVWSVDNTSIATVSAAGLVTKVANGSITLTATITICGGTNPITISKAIQVGVLTPTYLDYSYDAGNCYEVSVSTNYFTNATYTWSYYNQAIGATKGLVQLSNSGANAKLSLSEGSGTYNIGVTATNVCGTGNIYYVSGYFNCGSSGHKIIKVSPNPATSTLNVSVSNVDNSNASSGLSTNTTTSSEASATQSLVSDSKGVTNMYLYDFYTKQLVKKWSYQENTSSTYNLNVAGVKRGIYVLKMERDNISSTTKIILQ